MGDISRSKVVLALLLAVLFLFGAAAQAQPAFQVKDLNTTRSAGISSEYGPNAFFDGFVAMGGTAYLPASDGIHGFELWRSDGTAAGTRLVADVCPGSCASFPRSLTVVGGTVFFVADDGLHGPELWKTDGTPAGTVLVRDLVPASNLYTPIHGLTELNGKLLFAISPYGRRHELWTSDGTAAGTVRIKDFKEDTESNTLEPLARFGGKVLFIANDPVHGREFWVTDGTAAGTVLLKDVNPGLSGSAPGYSEKIAAVAGGKLFFLAISPNEGFELRVSNGTPAGTALVREIAPGPASYAIRELIAWGQEVFFFASADGLSLDLWKSDGTADGTRKVQTVPSKSSFLTLAGGRLFFFDECALWTSDGTPDGTVLVEEIGGNPAFCDQPFPMAEEGGKFLFFANDGVHGKEPWQSDGTPAGTSMIADLNPGTASSVEYQRAVLAGGLWYFRAKRGEETGIQLWTTNGTAAGTRMLTINRQRSAFQISSRGTLVGPRAFFDLKGTLLFQGGDGATGAELGRSDGTAAGTLLVKDLEPGPDSSLPGEFTRAGGTVFFRSGAGTGSEKLWKTDGTPQGTQVLHAPVHLHNGGLFSPRDLTALGNQLLFAGAWFDDFSELLLKSDGTPQGTTVVEAASSVSYVQSIVSLGNRVLFQADEELWRSDGTNAGTVPIATAPSLDRGRALAGLSGVRNGVLLFAGSTPQNGEELWRSDGTEAGTYLLAEIVPGPGSKPLGPFAVAGPALFFAAGGNELWKNDAEGTRLVRKLPPGDPAIGIRSLTALGKKVYFTYHDLARGNELWMSDGTEAGTRIVKDLLPGPGSSHPRHLHAQGAILLFSATDGVHGFELWRSNGTRPGTRMLQDIAPGALSSSPTELTVSGPNVYFTASDGISGFELWALPRRALRP